MSYLLVDESDGRVLAELGDADTALRLLDRLARRSPEVAEGLGVVRFGASAGALTAVASSVTLRVLPELPGAPGVPDLRR